MKKSGSILERESCLPYSFRHLTGLYTREFNTNDLQISAAAGFLVVLDIILCLEFMLSNLSCVGDATSLIEALTAVRALLKTLSLRYIKLFLLLLWRKKKKIFLNTEQKKMKNLYLKMYTALIVFNSGRSFAFPNVEECTAVSSCIKNDLFMNQVYGV